MFSFAGQDAVERDGVLPQGVLGERLFIHSFTANSAVAQVNKSFHTVFLVPQHVLLTRSEEVPKPSGASLPSDHWDQ